MCLPPLLPMRPFFIGTGRDLARKSVAKKSFKCVYLSLFIIITLFLKSESLLLCKLKKLVVAIGKKPAPVDHESSLKKKIASCPLRDIPVPFFTRDIFRGGHMPPLFLNITGIYPLCSTIGHTSVTEAIILWASLIDFPFYVNSKKYFTHAGRDQILYPCHFELEFNVLPPSLYSLTHKIV